MTNAGHVAKKKIYSWGGQLVPECWQIILICFRCRRGLAQRGRWPAVRVWLRVSHRWLALHGWPVSIRGPSPRSGEHSPLACHRLAADACRITGTLSPWACSAMALVVGVGWGWLAGWPASVWYLCARRWLATDECLISWALLPSCSAGLP